MSVLQKPGKPYRFGSAQTDHILIKWNSLSDDPLISYQVRYKKVSTDRTTKWEYHKDCLSENSFKLEGLEPNSKFVFQVRMILQDEEGPYSEISDALETLSASRYLLSGSDIWTGNPGQQNEIDKKTLPFVEDKSFRNRSVKTRKLVIGDDRKVQGVEKTILMLGPTGGGKSTMVDAMINYIFNVEWNHNFRYTLENHLEEGDKLHKDNQAHSQTTWVTCYQINPMEGNKLRYPLTIIDTPGFASVSGIEADRKITDQIEHLFSCEDGKGIDFVDAVCFVVKAPDARLTNAQKYIFNSILSIFQKNIIENFCMFITFADGKPPKVLAALKEENLPHKKYFSFNNSVLFATNTEMGTFEWKRSQLDWEMGEKSFASFFEALEDLPHTSLALSYEVLRERRRIEITIENMRLKLDAALRTIKEFRLEITLLKVSEMEIKLNENFKYTVKEIQLLRCESDVWNLNCKVCNVTCHKRCKAFNFNFVIKRCDVMLDGRCTQCKSCPSENHQNELYEHSFKSVDVEKTYEDMKQRFADAKTEMISHKEVISRMEGEMKIFEFEIQEMIDIILKCNQRLRQIALREDPLRMSDLLDDWICEERINKSDGWSDRVNTFSQLKEKANLPNFAESVKKQLNEAIHEAKRKTKDKGKRERRSNLFKRLFFGFDDRHEAVREDDGAI